MLALMPCSELGDEAQGCSGGALCILVAFQGSWWAPEAQL